MIQKHGRSRHCSPAACRASHCRGTCCNRAACRLPLRFFSPALACTLRRKSTNWSSMAGPTGLGQLATAHGRQRIRSWAHLMHRMAGDATGWRDQSPRWLRGRDRWCAAAAGFGAGLSRRHVAVSGSPRHRRSTSRRRTGGAVGVVGGAVVGRVVGVSAVLAGSRCSCVSRCGAVAPVPAAGGTAACRRSACFLRC